MVQRVADAFLFSTIRGFCRRTVTTRRSWQTSLETLDPQDAGGDEQPANFGMAKGLVAGAGAGFSGSHPDSIQQIMDDFNALPYEQRKAITDPQIGQPEPMPTIGPVVMPSDDEVRRSAAEAPVLRQFNALADFFKAGAAADRQGHNIRLADAGELSEILGTEPLEEVVDSALQEAPRKTCRPRPLAMVGA